MTVIGAANAAVEATSIVVIIARETVPNRIAIRRIVNSPWEIAAALLAVEACDIRHGIPSSPLTDPAARQAVAHLTRQQGPERGFWIPVVADALDDAVMPAVDYRLPGRTVMGPMSPIVTGDCQGTAPRA